MSDAMTEVEAYDRYVEHTRTCSTCHGSTRCQLGMGLLRRWKTLEAAENRSRHSSRGFERIGSLDPIAAWLPEPSPDLGLWPGVQ